MVRSDFIMEVRGYMVNPSERRLRAPWRITIWVFLAGFGAVVVTAVSGLAPSLTTVDGSLSRSIYGTVRTTGVIAAATVLATWIGYLLDRRTLADYGLQWSRAWWRDTAFGLALGLCLPLLMLGVLVATGLATVTGLFVIGTSSVLPFGTLGAPARLLLLAGFFVVQATAEEVIFRGYLLTNIAEGARGALGRRRAVMAATALTGILFGVVHGINPGATPLAQLNITLYGVFLGACYVLTGRLGVACGFHVAWNYALAVLGFPVSGINSGVSVLALDVTGPWVLTGGSFGPEGGLIAILALGVAIAALWWWLRREHESLPVLEAIATPSLRIPTRIESANQDG